jgi:hypothetical protein
MEKRIHEMVDGQLHNVVEQSRWGEYWKQLQNIVRNGLNRVKTDIIVFIEVGDGSTVCDCLLIAVFHSPNLSC